MRHGDRVVGELKALHEMHQAFVELRAARTVLMACDAEGWCSGKSHADASDRLARARTAIDLALYQLADRDPR
jgi:hypothetical protein